MVKPEYCDNRIDRLVILMAMRMSHNWWIYHAVVEMWAYRYQVCRIQGLIVVMPIFSQSIVPNCVNRIVQNVVTVSMNCNILDGQ